MTAPAPDPNEPLPFPAAGRLLGVSRWTVYAMVARGELRAVRVSKRRRVLRSEIARYLASQDSPPAPVPVAARRKSVGRTVVATPYF